MIYQYIFNLLIIQIILFIWIHSFSFPIHVIVIISIHSHSIIIHINAFDFLHINIWSLSWVSFLFHITLLYRCLLRCYFNYFLLFLFLFIFGWYCCCWCYYPLEGQALDRLWFMNSWYIRFRFGIKKWRIFILFLIVLLLLLWLWHVIITLLHMQ